MCARYGHIDLNNWLEMFEHWMRPLFDTKRKIFIFLYVCRCHSTNGNCSRLCIESSCLVAFYVQYERNFALLIQVFFLRFVCLIYELKSVFNLKLVNGLSRGLYLSNWYMMGNMLCVWCLWNGFWNFHSCYDQLKFCIKKMARASLEMKYIYTRFMVSLCFMSTTTVSKRMFMSKIISANGSLRQFGKRMFLLEQLDCSSSASKIFLKSFDFIKTFNKHSIQELLYHFHFEVWDSGISVYGRIHYHDM